MKSVNVNELVKYFEGEISVDDFNKGSGVYGIFVGSRGFIEEVSYVVDFKLRSKEELVELWLNGEDTVELREYGEEFCDSGDIDWNDFGGVYECLNEEESIEYYNVVV